MHIIFGETQGIKSDFYCSEFRDLTSCHTWFSEFSDIRLSIKERKNKNTIIEVSYRDVNFWDSVH